jgi:hypothetical protein
MIFYKLDDVRSNFTMYAVIDMLTIVYNTRYEERRAYQRVPCGGEKSLKIASMVVSLPLPHISRSLPSPCWARSAQPHLVSSRVLLQVAGELEDFVMVQPSDRRVGRRIGMMWRTIAAQLEWHLTLEFHDTHIKTRDFTCKDNNSLLTMTSSMFSNAFSLSDLEALWLHQNNMDEQGEGRLKVGEW